jgi:3-(3-hydroxy-phenyl)propionate hydroxylase
VEARGAVLVAAPPGTELNRWLRRSHARAALIRPDGTVQATTRDHAQPCTLLPGRTSTAQAAPTGAASQPTS